MSQARSLSRKFIRDAAKEAGIELTKEFEQAIIDEHVASRDEAIENATLTLNEQLEAEKGKSGTDEFKTKWEQEVEAHTALKDKIAKDEANAKKQSAIRALLAEVRIGDKRHDLVLKALAPDMDRIELDKDGKIKNIDTLKTSISTDWAEFIETTEKVAATTPTPPVGQVTPLGALQAQYDEAKKNGKTAEAIAAKNRMFELQKNGG